MGLFLAPFSFSGGMIGCLQNIFSAPFVFQHFQHVAVCDILCSHYVIWTPKIKKLATSWLLITASKVFKEQCWILRYLSSTKYGCGGRSIYYTANDVSSQQNAWFGTAAPNSNFNAGSLQLHNIAMLPDFFFRVKLQRSVTENPRRFWRSVLPHDTSCSSLKMNDRIIYDPAEIWNTFNCFFRSVFTVDDVFVPSFFI